MGGSGLRAEVGAWVPTRPRCQQSSRVSARAIGSTGTRGFSSGSGAPSRSSSWKSTLVSSKRKPGPLALYDQQGQPGTSPSRGTSWAQDGSSGGAQVRRAGSV